ncbi:MAG: PAS domain-containing protein [Deltaproteobacteria bacterium]|nr:PAS domain-containing protein [Deltaproteobacteria bacterium]
MDNVTVFQSTFILIALLLFVILLAIYALQKVRRGFLRLTESEEILEKGKIPGANKEMSFVFGAFQQTLQEITQKKQELIRMHQDAVERVRRMERYNECILESMVSGVAAFDRQGKLTSLNGAAARIFGRELGGGAIGQSYDEVLAGSEAMKEILQRVLQENRRILREEVLLTLPGGERKWLGVNVSPLKGAEGEMIGATLLFTDLTEVKELQRQVELKNRLAAMGEMSAGIAHEFRNSLGAILGYARLADRQAGENSVLREAAEGIITEVKSFDAMLSDFLHFARPMELNREACRLDELIREALEVLSDEIETKKAETKVECNEVPSLMLDRTLIRQSMTNLIKNALQAIPEGGSIAIEVQERTDRVEVRIRDNGPGIPRDLQKKIFEPFFTTKREGTGLGLAITQKTIVAHQGNIRIKSDPGQGTLMIVSLPSQGNAGTKGQRHKETGAKEKAGRT